MASTQPPMRCTPVSFSHSTGVWETTRSICLWLQTSCSSGATLRSPTRIIRRFAVAAQRLAGVHLVEERQLVRELRIDLGVRDVAAGRHIEIVHGNRVAQPGAFAQGHCDVPAIGLAAERLDVEALERQAREHDDAVIALLAVECDVLVAEPFETLERKLVVGTFGFLQAEDVRPRRLDEPRHRVDAQPHRVDVPGRDGETHGFDADQFGVIATRLRRLRRYHAHQSGGHGGDRKRALARRQRAGAGVTGSFRSIDDREHVRIGPRLVSRL